jgi:predicted nucleic acid-binding protein
VGLTLESAIEPGQKVLIDTSVALAYLSGTESTSPTATRLFDDFLASGRDAGAMSMITVGEILVRPFRVGPSAVAIIEGFLQRFAEIELVEIDYVIAREAARIRASTDLRMPDALILSSATAAGCDLLCTNDRSLGGAADRLGIPVCLLSEVAAS